MTTDQVYQVCLYARQACKWLGKGCFKDEELRPMFASTPERAVKKVWACQWAGRRLTIHDYLLNIIQDDKIATKYKRDDNAKDKNRVGEKS